MHSNVPTSMYEGFWNMHAYTNTFLEIKNGI